MAWARVIAVLLLAFPPSASAQLPDDPCRFGPPSPEPVWVVTAPLSCAGRSLLAGCGGSPSETCPSLEEALAAVPSPLACAPGPELLGVAEQLRDRHPAEARVLYRALLDHPRLAQLAAYRTAEMEVRLSEYRTAADRLPALLAGPLPARADRPAIDLYAYLLQYDDHDEDGIPDPDSDARVLSPNWLPSFPLAPEVGWRALTRLALDFRAGSIEVLVPRYRERFGEARAADLPRLDLLLDRIEASVEARSSDRDVVATALRGIERCRTLGEDCEGFFLDAMVVQAVEQLQHCGRDPSRTSFPHDVESCLAGAATAQEVLVRRPDPVLAEDVRDALRWAVPWAAEQLRPRSARRGARRFVPPPVPAPLRTTAPRLPEEEVGLGYDGGRAVDPSLLVHCAPPRGAVLSLEVRVDEAGAWSADAEPDGRTARCIETSLDGHLPASRWRLGDAPGVVHGHVWFPPE